MVARNSDCIPETGQFTLVTNEGLLTSSPLQSSALGLEAAGPGFDLVGTALCLGQYVQSQPNASTHVWSKEVGDVPISRSAGDGNKVPADEKADEEDSDWAGDGNKVPADEKDSDSSPIWLCCSSSDDGDRLANQKCSIGLKVCGCWPIC